MIEIRLLGGFAVERDGKPIPDNAWQQRRAAKLLVKLLALSPTQALHREQVIDKLWPEADMTSALNSFAKALHAARHALEPDLAPRSNSAYLHLQDDILALNLSLVQVDVIRFTELAQKALVSGRIPDCEAALDAYGGELLPEDRYEDWAADERRALSDLYLDVQLTLVESHEIGGALSEAIIGLRHAAEIDPTREEIHRRLMRLYARTGKRHQALRQFQICADVLEKECGAGPSEETVLLHRSISGERTSNVSGIVPFEAGASVPLPVGGTPIVGRARVVELLADTLKNVAQSRGGVVVISGETGVGKTRIAVDLAMRAQREGYVILWSHGSATESATANFAPVAEAIDAYVAYQPLTLRQEMVQRHPGLVGMIPSLSGPVSNPADSPPIKEPAQRSSILARFLSDLSARQPLVLLLSDLHALDADGVRTIAYLARLAANRPWLILGTYREEDVPPNGELQMFVSSATREGFCQHVELHCLARSDCDELVKLALREGEPDDRLCHYVYSLSRGNPLFAQQLIETLRQRGDITLGNGVWSLESELPARVPTDVEKLVTLRLTQMTEEVQRVLALASTAGPRFTFRQLSDGARAFGEPIADTNLLDALDQALELRILEEDEQGYYFRQPLFRAAVCKGLSNHRRQRLQAAVRGLSIDVLPIDSALATDQKNVLETYGERPSHLLLPWEAAALYGRLADSLDSQGQLVESAAIRQKLAAALLAMGKNDRALHVLQQAAGIYRDTNDTNGYLSVAAQIELLSYAAGTTVETQGMN